MPRPVFEVETQFTADDRQLVDKLRQAEMKVKQSAEKMDRETKKVGKGFAEAFSIAKIVLALKAVSVAIEGMKLGSALISGDWEKIADASERFSASIKSIPIVGDVHQIGLDIGEFIFGDKADAEAIRKQTATLEKRNEVAQRKALKMQAEREKIGNQTQSNIDRLREGITQGGFSEMANQDMAALKKLEHEVQKMTDNLNARIEAAAKAGEDVRRERDFIAGGGKAAEGFREESGLINEFFESQKRLLAKAKDDARVKDVEEEVKRTTIQGREISLSQSALSSTPRPPSEKPADKQGQAKTNDLLNKIAQLLVLRGGLVLN